MHSHIAKQLGEAQAELHEALAALANARETYQQGAGTQFAQAKARQAELTGKLQAAEAAQAQAHADFQREFEAAGYERNEAVRAALSVKTAAQDMAEATRAALARCAQELESHAVNASGEGRRYAAAYGRAYAAHTRVQAYEVLQQAGATIARAMALVAHVPMQGSRAEDSFGRPAFSPQAADELARARMSFIWEELVTMARQLPEWSARLQVDALGELDLGPLGMGDLMTPGQIHKLRHTAQR